MTDETIGTVDIRLVIKSKEHLDRLWAALREMEDPMRVVEAAVPSNVVPMPTPAAEPTPAPAAKPAKQKANGAVVAASDTAKEQAAEPLSRDDVRALLGAYAARHGMAAAVAAVKGMGVDHLDALPVERLGELAVTLTPDDGPDKAA